MKKGILAILALAALGVAGCVSTVTEENPGNLPAYRDRVELRFEKPLKDVFAAAKRALNSYGNIDREGSFLAGANEVCTIEGSVNQAGVWMRLESVGPSATKVITQIRKKGGGTDLPMAHELEQRIAFELAP
jgi:hypothetical protein